MEERLTKLMIETPRQNIVINGMRQGRAYLTFRHVARHLIANNTWVPVCKIGDILESPLLDKRFDAIVKEIRITKDGLKYEWVQYDHTTMHKSIDLLEEKPSIWDQGTFLEQDFGRLVFLKTPNMN